MTKPKYVNDCCEIIKGLLSACETLMDEACKQKATNWGIVNDAMVAGEKYLNCHKPCNAVANCQPKEREDD